MGYLVGLYDLYYFIYEKSDKNWNIVFFNDLLLYEEVIVMKKNGEKV